MTLKRSVVIGLEWLCGLLDRIPVYSEGRWYWDGGAVGCYWLRLAERSAALDERWGTGVWG